MPSTSDPSPATDAPRLRVDTILLPDEEPLDGLAMRLAGQVIRALHAEA